jgi:predicted  nucleic acid-binding Zn-ribbon protein
MGTAFASKNKNYTNVLLSLQAQINDFKATSINNVHSEYQQQVQAFNASSQGSNSVVASLLTRYNTFKETRDFTNNAAVAIINAEVATAQGVLNNASLDRSTYAATGGQQMRAVEGRLSTNQRILTDGVQQVNTAAAAGNRAVSQSAKSITDLADEINDKLADKIATINSNATLLSSSITNMMAGLDDSFFSLENSIESLRSYINADFTAYKQASH